MEDYLGQEFGSAVNNACCSCRRPHLVPRIYLWLTEVCNTGFKISDNSSVPCEHAHSARRAGQAIITHFFNLLKN